MYFSAFCVLHSAFSVGGLIVSAEMKLTAILLTLATPLFAAQHIVDSTTFNTIAAEYSGERAQELDRRIVEYHRIQGSPMMEGVAREVVLPALQAMHAEAA